MPLKNGFLLNNRYRILDILGQGGMGAVYRAVDENLDITVAVKENSFFSEEYARQFQREAKILASLRHPNLPRVFDYFVIDQQGQYLVMDYIAGDDLRQWMNREQTISENEALQIGIAICNALIYLHTRVPAIAHRDIKPGNVKITPSGEVVLVDFGLVKVMDDKEITTTAARAMTPGYSPPEQYGPDPTDHRSDIFSLGATLYASLAGYLPEDSLARATGKTTLTLLQTYSPSVSDKTAEVIEKALELRFEDRWQSAQEFRAALVEAREALPADARSSERLATLTQTQPENLAFSPVRRKGPAWLNTFLDSTIRRNGKIDPVWVIFGVLVLLLLAMVLTSLIRPSILRGWVSQSLGTPNPTTTTITDSTQSPGLSPTSAETDITETTPGAGSPTDAAPTISPTPTGGGDEMLAFVSERSGQPQIWMMDIGEDAPTQLTDVVDGACQPSWSPDGEQVVFTSPCARKRARYPGSSLYILDVPSGELTPLPSSLEGDFDPAWSPDGDWIAYTSLINGQMQLMKLSTADLTTVVQLSDGSYDDFDPAWSPDGERLAFIRIRSVGQVWLMDADGSDTVQFTLSGAIDNSNPAWYPRDDLILFSQVLGLGSPSKQLLGMRIEDLGEAEEYPIIPTIRLEYIPLMDNVDASPDGYWLAFDYWYYDFLSDIYIMAFPGSNLIQLTQDPAMDYDPAWRPAH
ncbi:serine/threonine-protein kinase [bacterium]|nr:serine/threonine-protein kinase [bacterium]